VAREFDAPEDPEPDWYGRQIIETDRESFLAAMEPGLGGPGWACPCACWGRLRGPGGEATRGRVLT
jgi:hypothetical protein